MKDLRYKDYDWMKSKYIDEKLSSYQIAEICNIGSSTADYWLRRHGISVRTKDEANKMRAKIDSNSTDFEEQIKDLYLNKKLSVPEISTIINMSKTQTNRFLKKFNITKRNNSECQKVRPTKRGKIPKETLEDLYCRQKLSTYDLVKVFNLTPSAILKRIKELGLTSRTQVESIYNRFDKQNHINITPDLKSIIEGELLGDGALSGSMRSSHFSRVSNRELFLRWIEILLSEHGLITKTKFVLVKYQGGIAEQWQLHSRNYPELLPIKNKWYSENGKIVPRDFELNPLNCRHWYLGDGHLNKKDKFINIATQSFTKEDNEFIVNQLNNKCNCDARLWKSQFGHGWVIGILKRHVPKFLDYLGPCPEEIKNIYGYKWNWAAN